MDHKKTTTPTLRKQGSQCIRKKSSIAELEHKYAHMTTTDDKHFDHV